MKKILSSILAALVMAGTSVTSSAKKITYSITGLESTGTNFMDYRLQKALPNDTFPAADGGFSHHIFGAIGVGVSTVGDSFRSFGRPGFNVGGQLGGWFTPIHGMRLSAEVGQLSVHKYVPRAWYGSIGADYLINLSALQGGYNPARRFEVIGSTGLEYIRIRQAGRGEWGNSMAITAGLQFRYNTSGPLYLFAEPKFAMTTGYHYDMPYDWRRMNARLSLSLGLGYRVFCGQARKAWSEPFHNSKDDNLYFGVGGGVMGFPRIGKFFHNGFGEAYIGKMLSSLSALQISIDFGRYYRGKNLRSDYLAIGSFDYVLNLTNAVGGYNSGSVFNLTANVGVSGITLVDKNKSRIIKPGVGAGLTAIFRMSPNWSLTFHPQLYMFGSEVSDKFGARRSPLAAFTVGLRYNIGEFSDRFTDSYADWARAANWFLTVGGGYEYRFRGHYGDGFNGSIGFGRRFTPVSSWHLELNGDIYPKSPVAVSTTLHARYLSSITTAMLGYDPERLMDVQLSLGAIGGVANYVSGVKPTFGLTSGLQVGFRLNSALDLYVEPQFVALCAPSYANRKKWTPEMRINLGLRYKLGGTQAGSSSSSNADDDKRNFVGVASGPNLYGSKALNSSRSIKGLLDISVGRWVSSCSGVRLTYANDWVSLSDKTYNVGSVHADYMLNLTNLIAGAEGRNFHIIGAVGLGVGFSNDSDTKAGAMTYGGVQLRWNLPANIDLHVEPGFNFWSNRLIPKSLLTTRFGVMGRVAVGASIRF